MDLYAYAQIDDLQKVLNDNNIQVPRLRGIRLMENEKPIPVEEINKQAEQIGFYDCESACESKFVWDPFCFELSEATRKLKRKYIKYARDKENKNVGEIVGINWDTIHGKKRKLFKYNLRMAKRRTFQNYNTFNKYCGNPDVVYIHARIGGGNWPHYRKEVENQEWFIEKVDDPFDSTYCDIYAKIKRSGEML
ncbi:MAG: hypothetical protein LIR46_12830 [Bacteroidota bacterium]|nr:hypothetical protein [Bacteroidota bacterium]